MSSSWGPAVPALGHVSRGGAWHAGADDTCDRCAEDATIDCSRCHKAITRPEWDAHLAWHRGGDR